MKTITPILALLLLLPGSLAPAVAGPGSSEGTSSDWPQWRGLHRDAISSEKGLIDRWGEAGPRVAWRAPVGEGFSSVSVAGGRLYTSWDEKGSQLLVCLDARTGEERWRRAIGGSFTHHYGNGPRVTPLVDEGRVFTVGTQGRLVALDRMSGKLLWQRDLVKEFGAVLPSYGYASSPLAVGDKLVIEAGGKNATFIAFDKKTGEVAWTSGTDSPAYSSPIAISLGGVEQVVFWSAHGLRSVAADDGKALWRHEWETFCPVTGDPLNTGTPIFVPPNRIFISSGSGAAVIQVSRARETFEVEQIWTSDEMRSDVNTSLLLGQYIYGFDRGILKCLDVRTGEVRWKARGFQRGSLIAADGKLIVLGEGGNLAFVEASPKGFVQRSTAQILSGRSWTSPSLAGGRLFLRNHEEIVCLDVKG